MAKKEQQKSTGLKFPKPVKAEPKSPQVATAADIGNLRAECEALAVRFGSIADSVANGLAFPRSRYTGARKSLQVVAKKAEGMEEYAEKAGERALAAKRREEEKAKRSLERKAKTYLRAMDQVNEYRKLQGLPPLDLNGKEAKIA